MSDAETEDRILQAGKLGAVVRPLLEHRGDVRVTRAAHRALADGEALIRAAEEDAAALRETARREGLEQGLARAAGLLRAAERARQAAARAARDDIAVLAVAAASKLLGRRLQEEPALVAELVDQALEEAANARRIRVLVGPVPDAALAAARMRLAERGGDATCVLEVDPALRPGDCVIETERGRVDARLELQFEAILRALLEGEAT